MYDAVIWAADHGVRVVNISWTGADSPTLNDAGLYLKNRARGLLAMAGVNGTGFLDYPNHPHIYCVSMTDAADNMRSRNGDHIDFSAPGFDVYSTTTGSTYNTATGTSFSTPLFSGVVASLFSINPTLSPDEVVEILKATADDLGQPGWDRYFGWGRIQFGRAAVAAQSTLPNVLQITWSNNEAAITGNYRTGLEHSLWKTSRLGQPDWLQITNAVSTITGNRITLTDPEAADSDAYYQIRAALATEPSP
jgi:subtilisin family serine protease